MRLSLWSFEWRLLRREPLILLLTALLVVLGAYASVTGSRFVRAQEATIAELALEERARLDSLQTVMTRLERGESLAVSPFADPRSPAVAGRQLASRYTILPPGPLAPLAIGQRDVQPFWALISTRTKQTFFVNDEIDNPVALLAGRIDLAFVVLVLYPLFILALTFDVVAGERERGTLGLVLSQPVAPSQVLTTKLLVRALVAVLLTVALSVAAALATGVVLTDPTVLARFALWCGMLLLYGAFWFATAMAVNARRLSSAASAVTLLGVWLLVVVILPAVSAAIISVTYPAPSRLALTTRLREATDAAAQQRQDALAAFMAEHPTYAADAGGGAPDPNVLAVALQDAAERMMAPRYAEFDAALDAQRVAADRLRLMSPALVLQGALLDLAGSGEDRFRDYERQFDRFHGEWRAFFNERLLGRQALTATDYAAIPSFAYREPSVAALLSRLLPGVLLLLVLTGALIWSARARMHRATLA